MIRPYQICSRCIMDTTDPDITFDEKGVCNHCHHYEKIFAEKVPSKSTRKKLLAELVDKIKDSGRGREYDCIIGVSGGVDSTYLAYLTKKFALRPLAIHLDNGWNSELAVSNIEKTLKRLDIDLFTYVINWDEFKDIQMSFLKASTPDSEIPTDHAIMAILYKMAVKHRIKYILLGTNVVSESIMPLKWGYGYSDLKYIKSIQKKFGTTNLSTLPRYSLFSLFMYMFIHKIKLVSFLNYIEYNKQEAMDIIQKELGWIYYGGKHYESIYTRFFQSYILPQKFNIDKRRAHYSNLICSGEMTRDQASSSIMNDICDSKLLTNDKEYVLKKFNISNHDFEEIMSLPKNTFHEFPNNYSLFKKLSRVYKFAKRCLNT